MVKQPDSSPPPSFCSPRPRTQAQTGACQELVLYNSAVATMDAHNAMARSVTIHHDGLQVRVVFTRLVPAFARREVNLQRVLAGSPVLEPSGVGKDVPRRNQIQARIALKKLDAKSLTPKAPRQKQLVISDERHRHRWYRRRLGEQRWKGASPDRPFIRSMSA